MYPGFCFGRERPEARCSQGFVGGWLDAPDPFPVPTLQPSAEMKERGESCLTSLCLLSWQVVADTFTAIRTQIMVQEKRTFRFLLVFRFPRIFYSIQVTLARHVMGKWHFFNVIYIIQHYVYRVQSTQSLYIQWLLSPTGLHAYCIKDIWYYVLDDFSLN